MYSSEIGIVATSLGVARDMAKAMIGVRDFNLIAERVSALNEQLLKAQDALLAHNAAMFQLQSENFEARDQLRKLQETISQRDSYTLVEVAQGNFAYRVNLTPQPGGPDEPSPAQPDHYVCQTCFDKGTKAVLGLTHGHVGIRGEKRAMLLCPLCERRIVLPHA